MKRTINLILLSLLLFTAGKSIASGYAYIYIEGDKQTPFYVKLEGQMMPRLGMNYCIIPNLDKGATKIEILFQQNKYPAQEFMVQIPESGSRAFLLERVNDRQFALKDMHNGVYLVSGNKIEDDVEIKIVEPVHQVMESENEATASAVVRQDEEAEEENGLPPFTPTKKSTSASKSKTEQDEESRFLSGIEFNREGATSHSEAAEARSQSGCGEAMSNDDFERFALRIVNRADDDSMLKELRKTRKQECFSTEQIRILANSMKTQSGRYQVVDMLYAQCADPEAYPSLESLFNTNFLKQKFQESILSQID